MNGCLFLMKNQNFLCKILWIILKQEKNLEMFDSQVLHVICVLSTFFSEKKYTERNFRKCALELNPRFICKSCRF